MTEAEAAVSTANATWALVYATGILAVLTLGVVIVAVVVPQWQRHRDKNDERARRSEVDSQAENAIQKTTNLVREVGEELAKALPYDKPTLWELANRIQTQRRVVEYFFVAGSVSARVPYRLSACVQALAETADGVQQAIDKNGSQDAARKTTVRANGAATAKRALERLNKVLTPGERPA